MSHQDAYDRRRWAGLAAVALLLALSLILLGIAMPGVTMAGVGAPGVRAVVADDGPLSRRPALASWDANRPALPGVEAGPLRAQSGMEAGPVPAWGPRQAIHPGFTVDVTYNALWGLVDPGDLVTVIRTADAAYGAAEADGVGFFWTFPWQANGQPTDVASGDVLEVYVDGALVDTISPQMVTGSIDVFADQVLGNIANVGAGVPVTVTVGAWGSPPSAGAPQQTTTTDANGDWSVIFSDIDLGAETLVAVDYGGAGSYVRIYLYPDAPVFLVQQNRQVAGYAPPFQTVTATVYIAYPSEVRWQATGYAGFPHGFYTINKPGGEDDAEPGDVVEVEFEDGTLLSTTLFDLRDLSFDTGLEQVSGTAPEGELVRASMWQLAGDELLYSETFAVANPGDTFQATFATADLRPRDEVTVAIADGAGHQTQLRSGPPFLDALLDPLSESDCLMWRVDGPGLPVTLTLEIAPGQVYTRENPIGPSDAGNGSGGYCHLVRGPDWGPIDFAPGSTVTLQSPTWAGSVVVTDIFWQIDADNNEVSGEAPAGDLEVAVSQWQAGEYPVHGSAVQTAMAASPFSVQFANFDVRDGSVVEVRHFDPSTDFGSHHNIWRSLETPYFEVQPPYGVGGVPPSADETVTAWLYDVDGTTLLASTSNDRDGNPWRFWLDDFQGYSIEPGYWLTLTADSGWAAGLQVPVLTVEADEATNLAWGEGPKSMVFVEHEWPDGWVGHWVPVDGYVLDWGFFGGDLQPGDRIYTVYPHLTGNRVRKEYKLGEVLRAEFWLEPTGHTSMWGEAQPGSTVTVTTPLTQVYAWADPGCGGCWNLYAGLVYPGDNVIVEASPGNDAVSITIPDPLTAEADSDMAQVWGQIGGWYEQMVEIHGNWDGGYQEVTTDGAGNYQASYGWMPRGADGYVRFVDQVGYTQVIFHRPFRSPDLLMNVNYGHDWVEGYYEPGHTLWLTVTDQFGTVKATAELQTQEIPWWGGQTGFSTNLGDPWVPVRPSIEVGDWVYGQMDDGHSSAARMGDIQGTLDIGDDTIAGNIYADWFTGTLHGWCSVWEENGPGQDFDVDPDGGSYFCDFGAMGWDLLPGHDVGVTYQEPDGDQVINIFEEPAPDMRVEKWTEGGGEVAPGGPVVFTLRYRNEGYAEAATIYLTDTLPADTTYVADSSGVAPTVGPGWVAWTLGPMAPGEETLFQLVLENTASPSETLTNQADIATLYDFNDWNDHAEAEVHVAEGQPDLYVNKNPNPGDPAQGQTMLWEINYGNNGPVASGPVVLADTIPEDTSIVSWFSENGYGLWTDNSTADQLILEAPAIPGYWGDRIFLRLLVNAPPGTQLTNTVEIATDNDANPDDNWHQRNDVWVGEPRWNAYLNKAVDWGQLVPGGYVVYHLYIRNNGNMAAQTWLTDTLPAGASFERAWIWTGWEQPFPPDYVDDEIAVWDLGVMEPGDWYGINVQMAIDNAVEPGTVFTNCAEISIDGDDEWPDDNSECAADTVRDYGPNLRVDKNYQWEWEGQLRYDVYIQNIGTQRLENVWITDTYPADTAFNDEWWVGHGTWFTLTHDAANRQLIFWAQEFNPGDTARVYFRVDLDDPGVEGVAFTNEVEAPIPDDVYPPDNYDEVTAPTGPDVLVRKWLSGGEPKAGEIVTFTVEFGNQNQWPWDGDDQFGSHLTDTLPSEMTFITATAPWDPDQPWHPESVDGNTIVWGWGTMWSYSLWRFDLVAQVTGDLDDGAVIVNTVEAYGDSPNDVEPDYDNNTFQLPLAIAAPAFEVSKVYETTGMAGSVVTYTLTVVNVGSVEATNVVLSDTLPAGLTYGGGDGSFDGTDVTWTLASIAANGGTATAWFRATLPGQGTIVNDAYRVVSSDQFITSDYGDPVSFAVSGHRIYLPLVLKGH